MVVGQENVSLLLVNIIRMNNVQDISKDVLQQVKDVGCNHCQHAIVMLEMIVNR